MKKRVEGKQENSKLCFVCGLKNGMGLKARFYQTGRRELVAVFRAHELHQSYPGRLHGGISAAILDETIGRAVNARALDQEDLGPMVWGVTVDLSLKYRKSVPLEREIRVVGRITSENARFFEGSGEILDPEGNVCVSATGRYLKLPLDKIGDFDHEENEWRVLSEADDPSEIELPD